MLRSIRARLIVASAVPSLLFLALGMFLVMQLSRQVQLDEFTQTLEVEMLQLIAWAQVDEQGAFDPKLPAGTRFEATFSGWYYQVYHVLDGGELDVVATSISLQGGRLNISRIETETDRWFTSSIGPVGEPLMIVVQRVSAEALADGQDIPNPDDTFLIAVARSEGVLRQADESLFRALGIGALAVLVFVALGTVFLVYVGLAPLRQVERSLQAIRTGEEERLKGDFPSEIEPLATEINLLIDENEKVIERARTQVGNLAHALKTPLSVLTNEASTRDTTLGNAVREQVTNMKAQVDRYLARARVAASSQVIGTRTEVAPVLERLGRAMEKINQDRGIALNLDVPQGLALKGEQQDLEEVAGNLLENAFKWAQSEITLSAVREEDEIVLTVEDDGPGIPEEERAGALKRGQRLDETMPGTGLGLSIVADIVSAYQGQVELGASASGGLRISIHLPAAR